VAARAGVGRSTASRAINGSSTVSDKARAAVTDAVESLGYIPNPAARALVTRRTGAVALVIAESDDRVFADAYFANIVRGISEVVAAAGRQLVVSLLRRDDRTALKSFLTPGHVDGVILLDQDVTDWVLRTVVHKRLPVVHGGRPTGEVACSYVDVDNRAGARLAVEHLLERGRRTIAMITGPARSTHSQDRLAGYQDTLAVHGIAIDPALVRTGSFDEGSGRVAMEDLLLRHPGLDGVFVASDSMAVGALQVLRDAGRRVPEDVSVVGFDDAPVAVRCTPALTTVRQPTEDVGRHLATRLLAQIDRPTDRVGPPTVLPTSLVVREST
jgi:DNA-binding LacI/PurR family transcriptional regulator